MDVLLSYLGKHSPMSRHGWPQVKLCLAYGQCCALFRIDTSLIVHRCTQHWNHLHRGLDTWRYTPNCKADCLFFFYEYEIRRNELLIARQLSLLTLESIGSPLSPTVSNYSDTLVGYRMMIFQARPHARSAIFSWRLAKAQGILGV